MAAPQRCSCFTYGSTNGMFRAVGNKHLECLKVCLNNIKPSKLNCIGAIAESTVFHQACLWDNVEAMKLLISYGALVNVAANNRDYPIHVAAIKDNPAFMKLLLAAKADVNQRDGEGRTALDLAVEFSLCNVIPHLLDAGATFGYNPGLEMVMGYKRCKKASIALLKVLRKRYRVVSPAFPNGYKLPLQITQQIVQFVWETRMGDKNEVWF